MPDIKLYNYFRSSASYRVRIALAIKNIDYEYMAVHLINNGGEQNSTDYSQLNPMRQVPTLVDNDITLSQSMAIIEYLEDSYPHPPLFPTDSIGKAQVREFCEIINSGMQPLQNLKTLQTLDSIFKPLSETKKQWMHFWMKRGFNALEEKLKNSSGNYCFGSQLTTADCFLIPQVFSSIRFEYNIDQHPNVMRVYHNLEKVGALQKARPENQPDFQ